MTNKELLLKIRQEIAEYQLGIHNISRWKYKRIINFSPKAISEKYHIDTTSLRSEDIAKSILSNGLNVFDTSRGLSSTVHFFKEYSESSFNYNYNGSKHIACNILIAIPLLLNYNGKEYFIGDLTQPVNIGNMILFNQTLAKAFIYGYYTKRITGSNVNPTGFNEITFSDELTFYENQGFWTHLSTNQQNTELERIFDENENTLRCLESVTSSTQATELSLQPSYQHIIEETRKQHHTLTLKKKFNTKKSLT